jgi:hypothetical protein
VFAWFFVGRVDDELVDGFGRHSVVLLCSAAILAAIKTPIRLEAGATLEPPPKAN